MKLTALQALPFLGPSGDQRFSADGAESLGAHCEGPFISPTKNGMHNVGVLKEAHSIQDLEECYGSENMTPRSDGGKLPIKMITAASERGNMIQLIPELTARGIIYSIGHSEATYEEATQAVNKGATMITHLFNAMRPLHHRNPGILGVLGKAENAPALYFGVICDGIHLHPTVVTTISRIKGLILVTDAWHLVGFPDGTYPLDSNNGYITKVGTKLLLKDSGKIAGR